MDEIEFDSLYAAARTYQDRRLGAGSFCDRCDHGHIYRRRGARVYCRSLRTQVPSDLAVTETVTQTAQHPSTSCHLVQTSLARDHGASG